MGNRVAVYWLIRGGEGRLLLIPASPRLSYDVPSRSAAGRPAPPPKTA